MTVAVRFRNVDVDLDASPDSWPMEAVQTILERGTLRDWRVLAAAIRRNPWGTCARNVATVSSWGENAGVDALFGRLIDGAQAHHTVQGRQRHAARVRALRQSTGLSLRQFAVEVGTSAATLSAYENAKVAPTTDTIARIEHVVALLTSPGPGESR